MSHHPNDMSVWSEIGCQRGCAVHPTTKVEVSLGGPTAYRDFTDIPQRFAQMFEIELWDTSITPVDGGPYCPARDAVSETIISHGVWEPQETTVLLCAFEAVGSGVFVDFGAQIGWFSVLAKRAGMAVISLEADPEVAMVLARNVPEEGVMETRVDADTPAFDPFNWEAPSVVKIDLEGAERHAIRMLQPGIDAGLVKYLMIEISPVFNDSYPKLVAGLLKDGFTAYKLPPKQSPPIQIEHLSDLRNFALVGTQAEIKREVAGWHQRDLLFVLGGIE